MRTDLKVNHDIEARKAAIKLFEQGYGHASTARAFHIPSEAMRRWRHGEACAGVRLRQQGGRGVVHVDQPEHGPADESGRIRRSLEKAGQAEGSDPGGVPRLGPSGVV